MQKGLYLALSISKILERENIDYFLFKFQNKGETKLIFGIPTGANHDYGSSRITDLTRFSRASAYLNKGSGRKTAGEIYGFAYPFPDGKSRLEKGFFRKLKNVIRIDVESGAWSASVREARNIARIAEGNYDATICKGIPNKYRHVKFHEMCNEPAFDRALELVQKSNRAGRTYQVLLGSWAKVKQQCSIQQLFREALVAYNRAPFSFQFTTRGECWFGNCALPHVNIHSNEITTVVLAGTRRAHKDCADKKLINQEFIRSKSLNAEHVMLVDLERNELGRVCQLGSVRIQKFKKVIAIGATSYLATYLSGQLDPESTMNSILREMLPRAVAAGGPKVEVMKLIPKLETQPRGFYTGCVGIWEPEKGCLHSATVVTCIRSTQGCFEIPCGGGITLLTDRREEIRERELKLKILFNLAQRY